MLNAGRTTEVVDPTRPSRHRNLTRRLSGLRGTGIRGRSGARAAAAEAFEERVLAELESGRPTCLLDLVDENCDGMTLEETGDILHITRERVRQIEVKALVAIRSEDTADLLEEAQGLEEPPDALELL